MKNNEYFIPKKEGHSSLAKLPEQWRLFELFRQHDYITTHGYSSSPYPEKVKRSEEAIIKSAKKILKENIKKDYLPVLDDEIHKFFYGDNCKIINQNFGKLYMLGPIGSANISPDGKLLDLDDIKEVYVETEGLKTYHIGTIHSENCGWICWMLTKGDKPLPDYEYLVAFNHHKRETAFSEVIEKYHKFNREITGRKLKRFFIHNRFWYHDELEKLLESVPYTNFLSY